jgi:small subunit ribosomal protein S6
MQVSERTHLRPYEGVIIMHPDTTEEEQRALFKRNKGIVESFGGSVRHLDTWGKRNLANPIETAKKALYFHTTFEAAPEAIAELERTMRINDRVLRFMHTRLKDGTNLGTFLDNFKKALADSATREREREAKFQARKAAQGSRGDRGGGFRRRDDDEGGGGGRGGFGGGRRGNDDMGGDEMGGDEGEM